MNRKKEGQKRRERVFETPLFWPSFLLFFL
jgi:hypothetical protein